MSKSGILISIHAPREGSDTCGMKRPPPAERFLSTLPARGATWHDLADAALCVQFLSTLPARGATDVCIRKIPQPYISIHAPREGSDLRILARFCIVKRFLSTLPARGATRLQKLLN